MRRVFVFSILLLATSVWCLAGCDNATSTCADGQTAGLFLTANPTSVEADGIQKINVQISGLDTSCQPLVAGTQVDLRLASQVPENPGDDPDLVGQFVSNSETSVTVAMTSLGGRAEVVSIVPGTAVVSAAATIDGEYLSALPVQLTFRSPPQDRCNISLTAEPPTIPADGASTSRINAALINYEGLAAADGTQVTFTTNLGTFVSSSGTEATALSSGGVATAVLRSEVLPQTQVADVTATFRCNDPNQSERSNQRSVPFSVGGDQPFVTLSASGNEILADGQGFVDLTAEVFMPDGTRAGADEIVTFTATPIGTFSANNQSSYDAVTDAEGKAYARFLGGQVGGLATVRAGVYINDYNAYDDVEINVRQVGFVEFVSASSTKLGVRGSGVNETSQVTFAVKDTNNQPFPNVLVLFTNSIAPGVTLEPTQARTDAIGRVSTTLKSGQVATSVTITATAQVGQVVLSGDSPALAIVGAKPNARFITFSCQRVNDGGFILDNVHTSCTVLLADRYSNKVGFATAVVFMTEAGQIDPSATTETDGADQGSCVVDIRTGEPRPKDVAPRQDLGEPYTVDGAYTRNPRDGLLTLVAATTGEEEFTDLNGSGEYDAGEPFVDLGEPFVDADDDGIRGATEQFLDSNGNQIYDGPNGVWDGDTLIWRPYWMTWHGHAVVAPNCGAPYMYSGLCPRSFNLPTGATLTFNWVATDANYNPLNATTNIRVSVDGKGSLTDAASPALPYRAPDMRGVAISLVKVNNVGTRAPCLDGDPICYMVPVIPNNGFTFGMGGWFVVEGPGSVGLPEAGSVSLEISYKETATAGATFNGGDSVGGTFGP
jgi:hypothetical protein